VHEWTGGGLHAKDDPGSNLPPSCGMLIGLDNTKFVRVYPEKPGTLECKSEYLFKVPEAQWGVKLNKDRIATTFLNPNIIKPQS
jgi:hypothetical protein